MVARGGPERLCRRRARGTRSDPQRVDPGDHDGDTADRGTDGGPDPGDCIPFATPTPTQASTAPATASPSPSPTPTLAPGATPRPTPADISSFLTAKVAVLNVAEEAVDLTIDLSVDSAQQPITVAKIQLVSFDSLTQSVPAATYVLTFKRRTAATSPVVCTLVVSDTASVEFMILPSDILVSQPDHPPVTRAEGSVGTSPLCKGEHG